MNAWAIALDSIWHHRLRSVLTALGVVIGVFAVVTLTALGAGVKSYITDQFDKFGATLVTVTPASPAMAAALSGHSAGGHGGFGGGGGGGGFQQVPSTLTVADARAAGAAAHVAAAVPVASSFAIVSAGSASSTVAVVGTTAPYFRIEQLTFSGGGLGDGFAEGAVLGHGLAATLFGHRTAVGRSVKVDGKAFTVLGVLKASGDEFGGDPDQTLYLPVDAALTVSGQKNVSQIIVEADSTAAVNAASAAVSKALDARHPVKDFAVVTAGQILSTIQSTLSIITAVLGGIAAISLIVGGIGIMNIMLVTVTERIREIGLRKAIGAQDSDILVQFLIESILLALVGGAIGTLVAGLAAHIIGGLITLPVGLSPSSVVLALAFSVGVGAVFGVAPAMNASRLMPADALRSE